MYNLAIIGYGGMGQWHHQNIKDRVKRVAVYGVYDIKPEQTLKAVENGIKGFKTTEELFNDENIDIVLVATPNNFHKQYLIDALKKGKNIISEKPVCMNGAELKEVIELSEQVGKLFTVHQNRRWDEDFLTVKKTIEQGLIGKPYFIESRVMGSKGIPGDWRSAAIAGGGMLYDWCVHLIDQLVVLLGQVKSVYARLLKVKFNEVDDCDKLILNFKSGATAEILLNTWCYINEARWHVSGDDGTLIMNGWNCGDGKIIKANIKEIDWEHGVIFTSTGRTKTMAPRPKEQLTQIPLPTLDENVGWEQFYNNVADVLDKVAVPIITHSQMMHVMKIIDACFESSENDCVVKL